MGRVKLHTSGEVHAETGVFVPQRTRVPSGWIYRERRFGKGDKIACAMACVRDSPKGPVMP